MSILLAKVVQTCWACPSQWDAWTPDGQYLYLRYRFGVGTVDAYANSDNDTWTTAPKGRIATFESDDPYDGVISLDDFMAATGLELAVGAETS